MTESLLRMVAPGDAIPHVIHQTYSPSILTPELSQNMARLKAQNPEFSHRAYDDVQARDYIREHFGKAVLGLWERIEPAYGAARADLFRYLLIYREGGVYLDLKSGLDRPLRDIIRPGDRYLLTVWDHRPGSGYERWGAHAELLDRGLVEYQQWHVIAAAGHPFLRAVILRVLENIRAYRPWVQEVGQLGVLRTTGPIPYSLAVSPLLASQPHRLLGIDKEAGLRYTVLEDAGVHVRQNRSHYWNRKGPVIKGRGLYRVIFPLYILLRRAVRSEKPRALLQRLLGRSGRD